MMASLHELFGVSEPLDFDALTERYAWMGPMKDCIQDPVHHAEGDVWIHTRMVLEALREVPTWRALPAREQAIVYAACLLHDVAKPWTTRVEGDRVTARGHSAAGAIAARRILWELGVPFEDREAVCNIIAVHQLPFFCVEDDNARERAIRASVSVRCDLLALVTEADGLGRHCADQQRILDNVGLFCLLAEELGCLSQPFPFASDEARVAFCRKGRSAFAAPPERREFEVTVMSGMPGSGKDRWIRNHLDLPMVSLDAIRRELGVAPSKPQGAVIAEARERARVLLRKKQPFVWNATNLSRDLRSRILNLALDYGARTRVVYVESASDRLFSQNRSREHMVPQAVMTRMFRAWDVPDLAEAHEVVYAV